IPLNKDSIKFTGPIQFNMGRSLNKINIKHIKGTGAFASSEGKDNKTFREEYILPYSVIAFHGLINENTARYTKLSDDDIELLDESTWNGTKNLITRSKMGHMPRIYIRVVYKDNLNYFIGDLQRKVSLSTDMPDEKLRNIDDYKLNIDKLIDSLIKNKEKIEKVIFIKDDEFKLLYKSKEINLVSDIKDIKFENKGI
ncbi:MAG: type I-B CRISPR-associated protein Cas7/Csh2, partial [Clostridiales bacterium]